MMNRFLFFILSFFVCTSIFAQKKNAYVMELEAYQKNYVLNHEVVPKKDKKYFHFFPVSSLYNVKCNFERITDSTGFTMTTSAKTIKHYYKYGRLNFTISGKPYELFVYQSKDLMQVEKYRDYLFVPFTDSTTGDESYGSGRYLEFYVQDIQKNPQGSGGTVWLDFNKAYNPYCAYSSGYKCPIPPRENFIPVAIRAGEMNFGKGH